MAQHRSTISAVISSSTGATEAHSQMLVDLSSFPIFPQQPPQHPLSPHPLHLGRHTSIGGTFPLTSTGVPTLSLGGEEILGTSARVDGGGFDDDAAVLDELLDVRARVGVADFGLLVGVEPDFALADARDGCGEPLLGAKVDHRCLSKQKEVSKTNRLRVFR